jgi:hypothetical protein
VYGARSDRIGPRSKASTLGAWRQTFADYPPDRQALVPFVR